MLCGGADAIHDLGEKMDSAIFRFHLFTVAAGPSCWSSLDPLLTILELGLTQSKI